MFDVGFAEIFLLALIGLIILGPEKLPRVARTLGGLIRKARTSWYSLRRSIEAELAEADVSAPIRDAAKEMKKAGKQLDETIRQAGETKPESEETTEKTTEETTGEPGNG